ncbi:MAG TPA: selenium-binding family protein [Pirellulales bacterium]|nr:selenium-binding family protein [Pirellulales bacterium]
MMHRRQFLKLSTAVAIAPSAFPRPTLGFDAPPTCQSMYASPAEARRSPRETLAYITATCVGIDAQRPDYLATVDLDPQSPTYSTVIDRLAMPNVGDELHHFGWNACSSCHADPTKARRYLVLPGVRSSRIHIADTLDHRQPRLHKVIDPKTIFDATNLSAPHTVHCLADGQIMLSMLGDAQGDAPGGFLLLDQNFDVVGRWENDRDAMRFNYDFWYQPRHNVMISSEWGAPNTVNPGFKVEDVQAGKYGDRLYVWDWKQRRVIQQLELGEHGRIPLEVRFHHDPSSTHGFVGAALSSTIWHWFQRDGAWSAEKVIDVEPIEKTGWPFSVPGLITDLVLSLDDRWLYFSNWLHGDLRQYDVSDPAKPRLTAQLWLGGVLDRGEKVAGRLLGGGPQMLQLSLDGKRLYLTNSLYSSWDNQFYPGISTEGSYLLQVDCDTDAGGLKVNERFLVDFGREPGGPARAHEIRFPGGDCTSDIWV